MDTFNRAGDCCACFVFLALCLLGLCSPVPGFAAEQEEVISERARAVIQGKGPDAIVMSVHGFKQLAGNTLVVPYNPIIYDETGKAIELKDLRLPCEATVSYKKKNNGEPEVSRLEVLSCSVKASAHFTQGKRYRVGEKMIAKPIEVGNPADSPPPEGAATKMQ